MYADDTALLCEGKVTKAIVKKMEKSMTVTAKYMSRWKIKMNEEKTQVILFPYSRSPRLTPNRPLEFENNQIQFSKKVTYLGVIFDEKLLFHKHLEAIREKTAKCMKSLYPLLNRKSKLSHYNKNMVYKSIIRPTMLFSAPAWCKAAKTNITPLQRLQNKSLKIINQLPWRYSTSDLHEETGYTLIKDIINLHSTRFFGKYYSSTYPLIQSLAE